MDVSFTFIDDNDTEYFVVVENKINASFTPEGRKSLEDYFKNSSNKYKDYVDSVKKSFETYKNQTTEKEYNQLTKYHLISSVIAKDLSIDESNIKYYVLAPEYKQDFCNREKNNYYYGEDYTVTSYKELKTAIDEVINIESSVFHTLPSDVKDIIIQFNRSIWPYISDSYTYYKRTMSNRFARTAKALHDKNT